MDRPAYVHISKDSPDEGGWTRRGVLRGAGLLIAFAGVSRKAWAAGEQPGLNQIRNAAGGGDGQGFSGFQPGGFIRISPDNAINLIVPNVEMGQGVYTSEAMLIAEELEVGLDSVVVLAAPANETLYRQPLLKSQTTGGSTSIRGAYVPLRQAGAAARIMLIGAAAARWRVPVSECRAEQGSITHGPSGRSLSYGALALDANRQPVPSDVPLKSPSQWKLIGTSARRVEGPRKVDGSATFGIDVKVPNMKIAAVAMCPVLGGTLGSVDEAAARQIPGIADVLRIDNAVAVTADHYWTAQKGLRALKLAWNEGAHASLSSADLVGNLRAAFGKTEAVVARHDGDVEGALRRAAKRVEAAYELPFLAHATMEPINTTIHIRPDGAEVWVGTQVPTVAQQLVAKAAGLRPEQVTINNQLLGGGFGRRLEAESIEQAARLAKQVSYPVKFIWSREEDIRHDLYRPAYYDRITAGLDDSGKPIAWVDHISGGSVSGHYFPGGLAPGKLDPDAVEGAKEPPYDLPAVHVDWTRVDPPIPFTWWRGVGPTHNVYVVESFIDECAHAAGRDPIDYRHDLLARVPRARNVLDRVARLAGWGQNLPARTGRGVSLHDSFGSHLAVVVEANVSPEGLVRLTRLSAVMDCGRTINPDTVKAQVEGGLIFGLTAALYSDITVRNGRVEQGNFNDYRMLRMSDTPPIAVEVVESEEEPGGVGETATVSAAPALNNAVFAATGIRLRRYPMDPQKLAAAGSAEARPPRTSGAG